MQMCKCAMVQKSDLTESGGSVRVGLDVLQFCGSAVIGVRR